ncbi:MAG TPA: LptF/LptG family permease [Gemmataceae bacterium]|nr:LptF/LptG family permease [Gemmataceae bacterium]
MLLGIVNRMILAELLKVFLMSLVALTGMFLLAGLIQEATQKGLSPAQILMAIPLIIPNTLPFTIPATTLFATCVVYGRMSADSEVLVLRAAGVNIYRLLTPAVILGILTSATTAALYYDTIPRSQRLLQAQLLHDAEDIVYGMLKREGGLRQSNLDYVLFVRDVQGRDLIDVVIKKRKADRKVDGPAYEMVVRAQTAKLRVRKVVDDGSTSSEGEPKKMEKLSASDRFRINRSASTTGEKYELVVYMDRCYVDSLKGDAAAEFRSQEYASPLPETIFGKPTGDRPSAQTWQEIFVNLVVARNDYAEMEEELRGLQSTNSVTAADKEAVAKQIYLLESGPMRYTKELIYKSEIEIQMRPALSIGCLCFVLIGCPVGIWASRSDYLSVFIICFLPTMFAYYPLLLASLNLAKNGRVPAWSAWGADVVGMIVALLLIKRLMKR